MGGKKKLSLRQMERTQIRSQTKEGKTRNIKDKRKMGGIFLPDSKSTQVMAELKKMNILTPYTIASHFDVRLSVANHFLKDLERQGIVEYVSGGKNLKIYKIAS